MHLVLVASVLRPYAKSSLSPRTSTGYLSSTSPAPKAKAQRPPSYPPFSPRICPRPPPSLHRERRTPKPRSTKSVFIPPPTFVSSEKGSRSTTAPYPNRSSQSISSNYGTASKRPQGQPACPPRSPPNRSTSVILPLWLCTPTSPRALTPPSSSAASAVNTTPRTFSSTPP